ncbi:MAG: GNAT family N-acetyltransferase [Chthoniobacterales bacterium]
MFAPADYDLRPLTSNDESLLWEMLYEALSQPGAAAPAREIVRRPEYARFVEGWGRSTDCGYVAHDKNEGTLLGAVWLRTPVEIQPGDDPAELAFAVKEGHRQHGIGASLLTQMVRANPKLSSVLLHVGPGSPAVRLFERFGFEISSKEVHSVVLRRAI